MCFNHQNIRSTSKLIQGNKINNIDRQKIYKVLWKNTDYKSTTWAKKDIVKRVKFFLNLDIYKYHYTSEEIQNSIFRVYIRKGLHDALGKECFTIAAISITPPLRRQGLGATLINDLISINPYENTILENTHNQYLRKWALKNNWKPVDNSNWRNTLYITKLASN